MTDPRQWVITAELKTTTRCEYPQYAVGELVAVDIVAQTMTVQHAITMISDDVTTKGFELVDITNCEILIPRNIKRAHKDLTLGIFSASNIARTSEGKVGWGHFVDNNFQATHIKPWRLTAKIKALPSWRGELDDREPIFINDALVFAVTEKGAKAAVGDALLEQHFEILEFIRCDIFDEHTTKPSYQKHHYEWGDAEVETLSQYYDVFLTTHKLTLGEFIWPEDVINVDI